MLLVHPASAGHPRPVFVYQIQAEGTLDQVVQARVEGKADVQDLLMEYCKMKSPCEGAYLTHLLVVFTHLVPSPHTFKFVVEARVFYVLTGMMIPSSNTPASDAGEPSNLISPVEYMYRSRTIVPPP